MKSPTSEHIRSRALLYWGEYKRLPHKQPFTRDEFMKFFLVANTSIAETANIFFTSQTNIRRTARKCVKKLTEPDNKVFFEKYFTRKSQ